MQEVQKHGVGAIYGLAIFTDHHCVLQIIKLAISSTRMVRQIAFTLGVSTATKFCSLSNPYIVDGSTLWVRSDLVRGTGVNWGV